MCNLFIVFSGMLSNNTLLMAFISLISVGVAIFMARWTVNRGINKAISKKANREELRKCESDMKIYIDNSDKSLLMMIKEVKESNNKDHDLIQHGIDERLKSMDCKLDLLINNNFK